MVKTGRQVACYYFYLRGSGLRSALIKVCAWFPYPAKVWVNGHEWAKRQALKAGISVIALSDGSLPAMILMPCRRSATGSGHHRGVRPAVAARAADAARPADQDHGYWWELSMRQVEISRTIVADAPRRVPPNVEIIFGRRIQRDTRGIFRTAIDRPAVGPDDQGVILNVFYKH